MSSEQNITIGGNAPLTLEGVANRSRKQFQLIDINRANGKELQRVPSIGSSMSERIIAHRKNIGNFSSVDQLLEIKGISKSKLQKMEGFLTVSTPTSTSATPSPAESTPEPQPIESSTSSDFSDTPSPSPSEPTPQPIESSTSPDFPDTPSPSPAESTPQPQPIESSTSSDFSDVDEPIDEPEIIAEEKTIDDDDDKTELMEEERSIDSLEQLNIRRAKESGFGVEKPIAVVFAMIGGFELPSTATMDAIEENSLRKSKLDLRLNQIVSKYGGVVDKIIQGFFMATFGTKSSHKHDSVYAVLAAMEMVEAIKETENANIHIGVNSGPAWVGGIGTGIFTDLTVMGDTVNLSARLKMKADTNEIVVSPATHEITKNYFDYETLPPVMLKGISEPVPIFGVRGKKSTVEIIELVKQNDRSRHSELQAKMPPHLQDKIAASTVRGERKLVTLFRYDLSGFTALSERFKSEPSKIAELMDKVHHELGSIVYKYEGVVDQLVGDALVAIFGAPIVHEDDPERAVQAGLECLEQIKIFSDRMGKEMGMPPLNVHIGINTGRISIGDLSEDGSGKMDYTVIGEPVELAEALEDLSEDGEILIGNRTYRLVRALFDCEKINEIEIGGKSQAIYRVNGRKENAELKRDVEALDEVFVGRQREMNAIFASAENFLSGDKGHVALLIGQAGLGKTHIKRELQSKFDGRATWMEGASFPQTETIAYSIFRKALGRHFGIQENDNNDAIAEKLDYSVSKLFENSDRELSEEIVSYIGNQIFSLQFEGSYNEKIKYLDPQNLKKRTFAAVRDLFVAESKRRPVILALDDLHWIDDTSLELIFFLMENILDERIFLLNIYRPERTDDCWEIGEKAEIRVPDRLSSIFLDPLPESESVELLNSLLTIENADQLKNQILQKSIGNPFYMKEIVRNLIDDGKIEKVDSDENRWRVTGEIGEIQLPDSIEQMMEARIDRMSDAEKMLLQNGAVAGRTFDENLIAQVSQELGEIDEQLDRLRSRDMLGIQYPLEDPPNYLFAHTVTHEIAYAAIPSIRRRTMHTMVANELEDQNSANLERIYEALAFHYNKGKDSQKAIDYLTKAGMKAQSQFNNRSALHFYEQAYERLGDLQIENLSELRLQILEGLGDVHGVLGNFDQAIENYDVALDRLEEPSKHRATLKRKKAGIYEKQATYSLGMALLDSAIEELKSDESAMEEAQIYNAYAQLHSKRGEFGSAIEKAIHALELAVEDLSSPDLICAIEKNLGIYYLRTRNVDRGREFFARAIDRARRIGDKVLMAQLYNNLGIVGQMTGRMDEAIENMRESIQLKEELGDAVGLINSYGNMGMIYSTKGELDNVLEFYKKGSTIARRTGALEKAGEMESRIGTFYWKQDDFHQATEHYLESLKIREAIGDTTGIGESYNCLVEASLGSGKLEAAESYADKGLEAAGKIGVPQVTAAAYNAIGLVKQQQEAWREAADAFDKAIEIAEDGGAKVQLAEAYHRSGEVHAELDEQSVATEYLQKSLHLFEQLKNRKKVSAVREALDRCSYI